MDRCDDDHLAGATKRGSVCEWKNEKLWEESEVEDEVEQLIVEE